MPSNTKALISYFQEKHKDVLGNPYMVIWGKDTKIMRQINETYPVELCIKLINKFFGKLMTDSFLQRTGASIGIFKTQIPKLLIEIREEKTDEKKGRW